ncbi:MAG TPA: hypothetical protein VG939_11955 [Caulobacteraceae bacterium]|nr:hypothetical protein [Caulobacteraceae bacterium]
MRRWKVWLAAVAVLVVIVGGLGAWWALDLRWRPHTIGKRQAEIAALLKGSGYVSPHLTGPTLYMVSYRTCSDCIAFVAEEFPKLHKAGVDTRVIMIARADKNGQAHSTPAERATVAELWLNRSWPLFEAWSKVNPPTAWTAPGVPPADGDMARTAVIEAGRKLVADLVPLLKDNGVTLAYPTLIWWDKDGTMRGCACENARTWRNVERELGA